jgi:hypothetical protein
MRRAPSLLLAALSTTVVRPLGAELAPEVEVRPNAESFDDRHRPEAEPWIDRPLALEGQLGLGAPLGLVGVALDASPSPGFSANLGVGMGESTHSVQVGLELRMRLIVADGFATFAEGGMGMGRYEERSECVGPRCPPAWRWPWAFWGNVGLGLELRRRSGATFRWSFGGASIFNVTSGRCVHCAATDEPNMWHTTVPYTLLAFGWAFPP